MPKVNLKYLFIAEYTDGSFYEQTPDDVSRLDPKKRSQFYDVLQSGKPIKRFTLASDDNRITVDLTTGIFEVNGLRMLLEGEQLPLIPERFDLIFYRQHTHDTNVTYDKKTGREVKREEAGHFIEYFIGWQCQIKGKNYQQKLAVA